MNFWGTKMSFETFLHKMQPILLKEIEFLSFSACPFHSAEKVTLVKINEWQTNWRWLSVKNLVEKILPVVFNKVEFEYKKTLNLYALLAIFGATDFSFRYLNANMISWIIWDVNGWKSTFLPMEKQLSHQCLQLSAISIHRLSDARSWTNSFFRYRPSTGKKKVWELDRKKTIQQFVRKKTLNYDETVLISFFGFLRDETFEPVTNWWCK